MNGEYDNERRGVLFKNSNKREGRQDPDYQGQAQVGGVEFWLSAWLDTSKKDGSKYMRLAFRPKDEQKAPQPDQAADTTDAELDDDIPFALFIAPLAGLLVGASHVAQTML